MSTTDRIDKLLRIYDHKRHHSRQRFAKTGNTMHERDAKRYGEFMRELKSLRNSATHDQREVLVRRSG